MKQQTATNGVKSMETLLPSKHYRRMGRRLALKSLKYSIEMNISRSKNNKMFLEGENRGTWYLSPGFAIVFTCDAR